MNVEQILELTWAPIIVFAVCLLYGILLLVSKNPRTIQGGKDVQLKNPEKFAVTGGKLLLFLAGGALVMTALLFVNIIMSVVCAVVWFAIFGLLWKRMSDQYGPF